MNAVRPTVKADLGEILRALALLCMPEEVYELRALGSRKGAISGYYNATDAMARDAAHSSDGLRASGVYMTINTVQHALLARASNHVQLYAKNTTADADVVMRRWLVVDLDPARPAGISATESEHKAAMQRAVVVSDFLRQRGFPEPLHIDSGNGNYLLYRIALPNDDPSRDLVRHVLETLGAWFDDERVCIDQTMYNAARIIRIPGTVNRKGDNLAERPHRLAKILAVPDSIEVVTRELLEKIAALLPKPDCQTAGKAQAGDAFDLERWIAKHGVEVKRAEIWNSGTRFILERCLFDPSHGGTSAAILRHRSGAIGYKCQHNSCSHKGWSEVRVLLEPNRADIETGAVDSDVARLAKLSPLELDKVCIAEAKRMGVRATTLRAEVEKARAQFQVEHPEPKPAPQWAPLPESSAGTVEGAGLLEELVGAIRRFVMLDESAAVIAALWVLFTWVFEQIAETNPYLRIISPAPGCGKSTLLKVFRWLTRSGWLLARLTPSSFARTMNAERRTLLLDEGDAFLHENEVMRNLLDGASDPDTATISLSEKVGDSWQPIELNVFVPIAIASIGALRKMETVEDRSISIHLKRATGEELKLLDKGRRRTLKVVLEPLALKCAKWATDNGEALKGSQPEFPDAMLGREQDKWEPLIAIAESLGVEIGKRGREIAVKVSTSRTDDGTTVGVMLIADLQQRSVFGAGADFISTVAILEELHKLEYRPWPAYGRSQKPISAVQLARLLKPFGVFPDSNGSTRGYKRSDLNDAFMRHPANPSPQPVNPSEIPRTEGESEFPDPSRADDPDGSKNEKTPWESGTVDTLTDEGDGEEIEI